MWVGGEDGGIVCKRSRAVQRERVRPITAVRIRGWLHRHAVRVNPHCCRWCLWWWSWWWVWWCQSRPMLLQVVSVVVVVVVVAGVVVSE